MLRLAVREGVDRGRAFESFRGSATLGRAPDNDVVLSDPDASRHHGRLELSGDRWVYRDLGSRNGSVIVRSGERVTLGPANPQMALEPGDLIFVGSSVLEFQVAGVPQELPAGSTVIAARTRAEMTAWQAHRESPEEVAAAYQLERDIGLAFAPEELLNATLGAMLRAFPAATHAVLLLVDRKTLQPKRQVARVRGQAERLQEELPVSLSVARRVLQEGHAVLFRDVPAEFANSHSVAEAGIASSLCAPLWTGEETVGLVLVESRSGPAEFTERDLDRLALFANRVALAIVGCELCEATRTNQLLRHLSNMITHDLAQPLQGILGNLGELSLDPLRGEQQKSVQVALGCSRWLKVLVAGILDVARMEAGEVKLNRQPLAVAEAIEEVLFLLTYQIRTKSLRVDTSIPAGLPPVRADRDFLQRILTNLLGNAVDLTPRGSRIGVSAAPSAGADCVVLTVEDEGPGIPTEHRERIFDKFFQAEERARTRQKMSVGLGLSFCKLAVEAQGGRIWVEGEPGRGSRFSFSLPIAGDSQVGQASAQPG